MGDLQITLSEPIVAADAPFPMALVSIQSRAAGALRTRTIALQADKWSQLASEPKRRELRERVEQLLLAVYRQHYSGEVDLDSRADRN